MWEKLNKIDALRKFHCLWQEKIDICKKQKSPQF